MVLCGRLGQVLPGTRTIPEQISENKQPYYDALEAADVHYRKGRVDVGEMERLLEGYLANQLVSVHEKATGTNGTAGQAVIAPKSGFRSSTLVAEIESKPVIYGGILAIVLAVVGILLS